MPRFNRGYPVRTTWCRSCQASRHTECDWHMNDGAGDAEDFVEVRCECPCDGQLQHGEMLIDLVASLRREIHALENDKAAASLREGSVGTWGVELAQIYDEHLHDALFDDEGKLSPQEIDVLAVLGRMDEIFDDSPIEAVVRYFSSQQTDTQS